MLASLHRSFDPRSAMPIRWVAESRIHLTLAFLGDVPRAWIPGVRGALERAVDERPSLELGLGELGAFPSVHKPRVLWIGLVGDLGQLAALQHAIARELRAIEVTFDDRPFEPHLTLGRLRHDAPSGGPSAIADRLRRPTRVPDARFVGDRVELVSSTLGQGPPRYEVIASVPLRGPKQEPP